MKRKLIALVISVSVSWSSMADIESVSAAFENSNIVLAQELFSKLSVEERKTIEAKIFEGRLLLANEESEEAFEYFEALSDSYKENAEVNYYLGVSAVIMAQKASIFSKLGYAEDFLSAMGKTLALQPEHSNALNTLIGFHLAAPSIAGGDTDKALSYAKKLHSFEPEIGFRQLAEVYWKTSKKEFAFETFAKGLLQFPESGSLYYFRAFKYIEEKQWNSAKEDLVNAVKFSADEKSKGRALYQQGVVSIDSETDIDLGINALQEARLLAHKTEKPWVEYRLAQIYVLNNEYSKAKEVLTDLDYSEQEELKGKVKKLKKKLKKALS